MGILNSLEKDKPIGNIIPLKIAKWIKDAVGNIEKANKMQGDDLLVFCKLEIQMKRFLELKMLDKIKVKCQLPKNMFVSKGVIYGEEIKNALKDEKVKSRDFK